MGIFLTMSWEGRSASDFSRVFATAAAIRSFKEPFEEIAKDVVGPSIQQNFNVGGRPAWEDLAESTIRRKSAMGMSQPSKILYATGAMEGAATASSNYKISDTELRAAPFGIQYWGYHQTGNGVPKRTIMMLQAADRTKITAIFAKYIRNFMVFDPRQQGARVFTGGRRF